MDALDGSRALDGARGLAFRLRVRDGASYALDWRGEDVPFAGAPPLLEARLSSAQLSDLPDGVLVLRIRQTPVVGVPLEHGPFALVADTRAPLSALAAEPLGGHAIRVAWSASDAETGVDAYTVMAQENGGAWVGWIGHTRASGATFSGAPGRSYAFRVAATDALGHVGDWAVSPGVAIDPDAPKNDPPSVRIASPAGGVALRALPAIIVDARDPQGSVPLVKVCAHGAGAPPRCAPEEIPGAFVLDAELPEGVVELRASATDGTLAASAAPVRVTIDRTPPAIEHAGAAPRPGGAMLALRSDAAAASAEVLHEDGRRIGEVPLERRSDRFEAYPPLPAGRYHVTFLARDAAGNEATSVTNVTLGGPTPALPPATPDDPVDVAAVETVPQRGTPAPAPLAVGALALAAAAARRR